MKIILMVLLVFVRCVCAETIEGTKTGNLTNTASNAGAITYVGAGCNFSSIQDAINNQNVSEIRLVGNFTENIYINRSVSIVGGYSSCGATNPSTNSTITGNGVVTLKPVVRINQINASANVVVLKKLLLTDGYGGGEQDTSSGGGLHVYGGTQNVTLTDVQIYNNESINAGGGISIEDGGSLTLVDSPIIFNMAESKGGGVFCRASTIIATGSSAITNNHAHGAGALGGGLYLHKCQLNYSANQTTAGTFNLNGISDNQATVSGAGVYVDKTTANVNAGNPVFTSIIKFAPIYDGENTASVKIMNNTVTAANVPNNGAAIATGCMSQNNNDVDNNCVYGDSFEFENIDINLNSGATNVIKIAGKNELSIHCNNYDEKICNDIHSNTSIGSWNSLFLFHTVTYSETTPDSTYSLSGLNIFNNNNFVILRALQPHYFTDYINSPWQLTINIGRSLIYDNHNLYNVARAEYRADMSFSHLTIANNEYNQTAINDGLAGVFTNGLADSTFPNSYFLVQGSLIDDGSSGVITRGNDSIYFNCNLYGMGNVAASTFTTNSGFSSNFAFADSVNHDYHLTASSDAIDYCNALVNSPLDMDGEGVPWDDPNVTNLHGEYDLGPDEYHASVSSSANLVMSTVFTEPNSFEVNQLLSFTHNITNNGPDAATDILVNLIPDNLEIMNFSSVGNLCVPLRDGGCKINSLAVGSTVQINVLLKIQNLGSFTHSITSNGYEADVVPRDNYFQFTNVATPFDLIFKNGYE